MRPIPPKAAGSRYGCCGIRIDGTPEFIDAVLSNLKSLLDGENHLTRLELARNPVKPTEIAGKHKGFENAEVDAECCYIRLHLRGHEGVIASGAFSKHLDGATKRYAEKKGIAKEPKSLAEQHTEWCKGVLDKAFA